MNLYLVHHSDAVSANTDPQRPLSARGLRQAERIARDLAERAAKPAVVWHSGKLRARQTAETVWRAVNPFAEFKMIRGLRPEDSPQLAVDLVEMEDRDVMLVSHMPLLPALLEMLTRETASFPVNGAVALERTEPRRYGELWRLTPPE